MIEISLIIHTNGAGAQILLHHRPQRLLDLLGILGTPVLNLLP